MGQKYIRLDSALCSANLDANVWLEPQFRQHLLEDIKVREYLKKKLAMRRFPSSHRAPGEECAHHDFQWPPRVVIARKARHRSAAQ